MSFTLTYETQEMFARARVEGSPTFAEFLELLQKLGRDSAGWPQDRVLIDHRGVNMRVFDDEDEAVAWLLAD